MSDIPQLPTGYVAFDELEFCSNVFRNVRIPVGINGDPLVLVGRGPFPLVWLAAPSHPSSSTWTYVVKESLTANPGIRIEWSKSLQTLTIGVEGVAIFSVKMASFQRAAVTLLDMRPLGLNVVGNQSGLTIDGNHFSQNEIVGAGIGLNLNVPGAKMLPT